MLALLSIQNILLLWVPLYLNVFFDHYAATFTILECHPW